MFWVSYAFAEPLDLTQFSVDSSGVLDLGISILGLVVCLWGMRKIAAMVKRSWS